MKSENTMFNQGWIKNFTFLVAFASVTFWACERIDIKPPQIDDNANLKECNTYLDASKNFKEIPNLDFEIWGMSKSNKFEEPLPNCFWTTPNNTKDIINAFPVGVTKVSGDSAYSGKYAVMLKTGKWGNILAAATVASGEFAPNLSNPLSSIKFGKPSKLRPKKVTGYYMYFPVKGDSCGLYCFVTKTKKVDNKNVIDTIGFSRIVSTEEVKTYRQFELNLQYKSEEIPDRLVIYFASSEAGDELKGQVGTTLFIDGVKVEY